MKSTEEIELLLSQAANEFDGSECCDNYSEGVVDALQWVLGRGDRPFDESDFK